MSGSNAARRTCLVKDLPGALAYEHDDLVALYAERQGVPIERAQALFLALKQFLIVCAMSEDEHIKPSTELDQVWHHFILHTRAYAEYCQRYFGFFLHHTPPVVGVTEEIACRRMQVRDLAEQLFGELDNTIWSAEVAFCSGNTRCRRSK